MPLKASVEDRLAARRKSSREYRRRKVAALLADGRCVLCRRKHTSTTHRCAQCSALTVDGNWRRYQRESRPARPDLRDPDSWNFETDELITEHITLARRMALAASGRLPSTVADVDDLIGDAMYGLVVAGRTYDPDKAVPFEPWAATKIKGAIYNGVHRWTHGRMKNRPVFVALQDWDGGD